jgi:hypothetical protein
MYGGQYIAVNGKRINNLKKIVNANAAKLRKLSRIFLWRQIGKSAKG